MGGCGPSTSARPLPLAPRRTRSTRVKMRAEAPMRLPQFTTRRLMVLVAVAAVALGWMFERRSRFQRLAEFHSSRVGTTGVDFQFNFSSPGKGRAIVQLLGQDGAPISPALSDWHHSLAATYRYAARHPWLPVPPDPPPPK